MDIGGRRRSKWMLVAVCICAVALGYYGAQLLTEQQIPGPISRQSATDTPTPADIDPIEGAAEAIAKSLERFPADHNPHAEVARLVSRYAYEVWKANGTLVGAPPVEELHWDGLDPEDPVWLVGILGDDLLMKDVLDLSSPIGSTDPRPTNGAYFGWDANSGGLMLVGTFLDASPHTYSALTALVDEPLTPVAATLAPTEELITPLPTQTWSAEELATAIAQLTAQASTDATPTP